MDQTQPSYRVAAVQMEPKLGQMEANLERILSRIDEAAARRARASWFFPSARSSGYGFRIARGRAGARGSGR